MAYAILASGTKAETQKLVSYRIMVTKCPESITAAAVILVYSTYLMQSPLLVPKECVLISEAHLYKRLMMIQFCRPAKSSKSTEMHSQYKTSGACQANRTVVVLVSSRLPVLSWICK